MDDLSIRKKQTTQYLPVRLYILERVMRYFQQERFILSFDAVELTKKLIPSKTLCLCLLSESSFMMTNDQAPSSLHYEI